MFASVRPTSQGWTVYEVAFAGVRMPSTQVAERRSYGTLDEAMAAAERRNRLLRKRDAEWEASWPLNLDPLPWEQPRELYASDRTDDAVRWHLERFAARAAQGGPPRRAEEAGSAEPDPSRQR